MVLAALGALAGIVKVKYSYTAVDSHVFRLHYRWTTTFCFACCALIIAKEYIGGAIECIVQHPDELKAITTYCWITSTFTINSTGSTSLKGVGLYKPKYHVQKFHSYYQWVPLVLFMQGCIFYIPHVFWKWYENKRIDRLLQDLNKGLFHDKVDKKKKNILEYLKESWGLNTHYATIYHLCEVFNFVNVLSQMYIMDRFFGGFCWNYGSQMLSVLRKKYEEREDVLIRTFPRLTKCEFMKFGPSGSIVNRDVLCVLPQNVLNEKIFLVMWIWFVLLAVITGLWLIWRLALMYSSSLRLRLLQRLALGIFAERIRKAIDLLHLGDFCLLENIGYNLDISNFRDILCGIPDTNEYYQSSAPVRTGTYRRFNSPPTESSVF